MVQSQNNKYATLTLLMAALSFSLSGLPGFNSEAQIMSRALSSSSTEIEVSQMLAQVPAENPGQAVSQELVAENSTGQRVMGTVTAYRKTLAPGLGEDPANAREVVMYEFTNLTIQCRGCPENVMIGEIKGRIEQREYSKINEMIKRAFEKAALQLAEKAKVEKARLAKIHRCDIDEETGEEMRDGSRAQLQCRVNRMGNLDERKREDYYDTYLRDQLQGAIRENSGPGRAAAMQMVSQLQSTAGSSTYLRESVNDLKQFGDAHLAAEQIIAHGRNHPQYAQNLQKWNAANAHLRARGLYVNEKLASELSVTETQRSTQMQELDEYARRLQQIASQHGQLLNGTSNGYNVRPIGQQGRQQYGAPVTSYPGLLPPSNSTAPGVARPGVQQPGAQYRPGMQQPQPGYPGRSGVPVPGTPVLR